MIVITHIEDRPFHQIPYAYPERGGRVASGLFPLYRGGCKGLPEGLSALVAASDLQGREPPWLAIGGAGRLLGEVMVEELLMLSEMEEMPRPESVGIVLAGDLFVVPDLGRRGGHGDVRPVWEAFRQGFRWVTGVAGNHDRFGDTVEDLIAFGERPGIVFLDGETREVDGLRLGGVSGVIGNPSRVFRRPERDWLNAVQDVLSMGPDLLVVHEGPDGGDPHRPGTKALPMLLEQGGAPLTVCGHTHWESPRICETEGGRQILNAAGRAYVLCAQTGAEAKEGNGR